MERSPLQVTPIPARRASTRTRPELRVHAPGATHARLQVVGPNASSDQRFELSASMTVLEPDLSGLVGDLQCTLQVTDREGQVLGEHRFPYELVDSGVRSTRLIDGCWISLYHWSEDEARWFNPALRHLTAEDWFEQIRAMKHVGIDCVVIQNVFDSSAYVNQHDQDVDSYEGRAFYPSRLYPGRTDLGCPDPVEAVLAAADELDCHVFLGVGLYAWFDYSPDSLEWHERVTSELWERYGHHPSLYSWYVSEEMFGSLYHDYDPVPDENWRQIVDFFAAYREFVTALTPTKPVSMAPNNIRFHEFPDQWAEILAGIDILIPFAFARDLDHLNITEIAEICARSGTRFWVDMEMFRMPLDDGLIPKTGPELEREIAIYDEVEQIFGYQFTGLMNAPDSPQDLGGEAARQLYRDYEGYRNRLRRG